MATAKQIPGRRLGQRSRRRSPPQQGRPQAPAAAFQPSSPQPCSLSTHFAERQSTLRTFSLKRQGPQRCRLSTDPPGPRPRASMVFGLHFGLLPGQQNDRKCVRGQRSRRLMSGGRRGGGRNGVDALYRGHRGRGPAAGASPPHAPLFTVLSRILGLGSETFKGKERIRGNLGPA